MINHGHPSKKTRFFAVMLSFAFTTTTTLHAQANQVVFVAPATQANSGTTTGPIIPWDQVELPDHPMLSEGSTAVTLSSAYSSVDAANPVTELPVIPTVPVLATIEPTGTPNRNHLSQNQSDIQMLPWSYVRTFLTPYEHIQVYDVLTGLSYTMYSFSNGNHADVRTVSQADTDILFQTFGHQWGWNVRPVWVTIGERTIAASINGQPHGANGNPANGMGGHVCLHFFGSSVHNGNLAFAQLHQEVLQEAYAIATRRG